MSKFMIGPVPSPVTYQTQEFQETAHLPLSEQFKTIQSQAKLGTTVEQMEIPTQTVTLAEIM